MTKNAEKFANELLRLAIGLLSICAVLASSVYGARAQQGRPPPSVSLSSSTPSLSDGAKKQLKDKLNAAAPVSMQVVDADDAPLQIREARVSFIKLEGNYDSTGNPVHMINDYAVK